MKQLKILATAKQAGSASALISPIKELQKRGHEVTVIATGNESEARGFRDVKYEPLGRHLLREGQTSPDLLESLVHRSDVILTGLSGANTPDTEFIRAANQAKIPSLAINDQDINYHNRFSDDESLPTIVGLMNEQCEATIAKECEANKISFWLQENLLVRAEVIGWTAFDDFARIREEYMPSQREEFLRKMNLGDKAVNVYFSQTIHPDTKYLEPFVKGNPEMYKLRQEMFDYELKLTQALFEAVSDVKRKLIVKPHPGEEFPVNYTKDLADKFGFTYLPAKSCDTRQLILAADAVFGGKSTVLTESCLLDRNTCGLLPEVADLGPYPAAYFEAIPYAKSWPEIPNLAAAMTNICDSFYSELQQKRTRFSVDGKAGQRAADLVESLVK